jgi:hypothetical protein
MLEGGRPPSVTLERLFTSLEQEEDATVKEEPAGYRYTLHEAGKPPRELMTPPDTEEATIDEMVDLLRDLSTASAAGRRNHLLRIRQLLAILESPALPRRKRP